MSTFAERLEAVEERIARALRRSGRKRSEITLVAVTKKFPADVILEAHAAGLRHFGENYVQEFAQKHLAVSHLTDATFHLIGHLQSNKAKQAAENFNVIETVDSARLASRLDSAAGNPIPVLIEVKLSHEESKTGANAAELPAVVDAIRATRHLQLQGLMTVPPWSEDPEHSRSYFRQLCELARKYNLSTLSMGMSGDLEAAIEEGATAVRVGTALFGPRPRPK